MFVHTCRYRFTYGHTCVLNIMLSKQGRREQSLEGKENYRRVVVDVLVAAVDGGRGLL